MLKLEEIMPGPNDRAAFVGQTGSGKTTLAHRVLMTRPYVVVLDPKGLITWPRYERHTTLAALMESKAPKLLYAPVWEELESPEVISDFFEWIYERQNTVLYVDEIYAVAKGDVYPRFYGACLTRGRERGIAVYTATQRPARVPQIMFSESEHVYCFHLKMPRDRERVAEMTGIDENLLALPKHRFYYAPQDGEIRGPMELELPEVKAA